MTISWTQLSNNPAKKLKYFIPQSIYKYKDNNKESGDLIMSADLIITELDPQINGVLSWENVLKGYFIDVYNHTGVFAVLSTNLNKEYSWVATYHRSELFQKSGEPLMHITGIKKFLQEMETDKNQFFSLKDPVIEDSSALCASV